MSNSLAIGAVSVVLKDRLQNGLASCAPTALGAVQVSALPPDRIATGTSEQSQLNLFLYHVTSNNGWSNVGLPSHDAAVQRLTNPPLALNLHYLLTAYGAKDFHPEILLGCGMQVFHETPVLSRQAIRDALPSPPAGSLPVDLPELADTGLADQIELIKITPQSVNTEEISKLWTAMQAHYRPTAAYLVTVVLIEAEKPARSALPVLARGVDDRGVFVQPDLTPPFPTLTALTPPNQQPSVLLGDVLTLEGHHLDGTNISVRFTHPRLSGSIDVTPLAGSTATHMQVGIPNTPPQWAAGYYTVSVSLRRAGEIHPRTTNELPLSLAPQITSPMPMTVARDTAGSATINLNCAPEVRPAQRARLLLGSIETPAEPHPTQTNSLSFVFKRIQPDDYWVRLRIDGVDSLLINRAISPPQFFANQKVTITP